jgi:glycerol-3-phosphate cytidylyltransferase
MKSVITYGTFDIFHIGHLNLLERLNELGDRTIVGLSTDQFNLGKSKTALMSYEDRKKILESNRYIDLVIPENTWEQKISDVQKYNVDIFAMGADWRGKFDFLSDYCKVIYLPRTSGISSTSIKRLSSDLSREHVRAMLDAVETMSQILKTFDE